MPQRLARRSAGEQVAARAERLSDDLLILEEECFRSVWAVFDRRVDPAADRYVTAWKRAKGDPKALRNDARLEKDLVRLHDQALAEVMPLAVDLAEEVRAHALDAIDDELRLCEQTLAKKYAGVTDTAMLMAYEATGDLIEARVEAFADQIRWSRQQFPEMLARQVGLAAMYDEDQDRLADRLFKPEKNTLRGNSGRGVWWRAAPNMTAAARDVSIRLASQTRRAAMQAFNEVGAVR